MSRVAGVDFGTLGVRVAIFDSARGRLGAATAAYPLQRSRSDPDRATQSHADHMRALAEAVPAALAAAQVAGASIEALALATTGSSVIPVDERLQPLDDYYLWCDHRAWREAEQITAAARAQRLEALDWSGGAYSAEWGWAKLLHWLRHNPGQRDRFATALEHCDMVVATLCGVGTAAEAPRSVCAMGHKWMWNPRWGGYPPESFLAGVDPLLAGVRGRMAGRFAASDQIAGRLSPLWAERLGLAPGIPIPAGALDAHWDAIAAGIRLGDVVNVVGTSTCIMAISDEVRSIPGVCGVAPGSVHPSFVGIEAGLSATGDLFDAIARRAQSTVAELAAGLEGRRAAETGLLRLSWDNGDRTVLANPELSGITLGWRLGHTAQDELFAAIEGTAMHTRIILERLERHGVPIQRLINGGGIPRRNPAFNRVYANVLAKPILVPADDATSLGAAMFAFLAAGTYSSLEAAQAALCPDYVTTEPDPAAAATYEELYREFRRLYFAFGSRAAAPEAVGGVLPRLRELAERKV